MSARPASAGDGVRFAEVDADGRRMRIEYAWIAPERDARPLVVFLHEGLGSLAMWKDFPRILCDATGTRGLVYSRPWNGRSTARRTHERFAPDYQHEHARVVLPAFLRAVGVDVERPWLFGHSDGASIALLFASCFPRALSGLVVMAPHVFVERKNIDSIAGTRSSYLDTDLRERLGRYHDDVDSAFWGWNDVWLDPAFRAWNIEEEVSRIECPVLAIQGDDDEYGTVEQMRRLARRLPDASIVQLPECRHSPHRDQPERVIGETMRFMDRCSVDNAAPAARTPVPRRRQPPCTSNFRGGNP